MRDKIFYISSFGFLVGVLLRSFSYINTYFVLLTGAISLALFIFSLLISQWRGMTLFFILIFTISLGAVRFHSADINLSARAIANAGENDTYIGTIVDEPIIREKNQAIEVRIDDQATKILATLPFGENFKYGDQVKLDGRLEEPENFKTDTGKEFDYVNYLRKDGILYVMSYPNVKIISHGNGNPIRSALFTVKEKFLDKINFAIPASESLLMGGLILGERSSFSAEQRQDFIRTGTIHIIALSGYNITIVAEWFMKLFSYLPQMLGIGAGIIAILLFILLTGASSTALRAGIMATLALIARATGRTYDIGRALLLAGVLMVLVNPFILVYDVSFQLSFIATIAVIYLSPKLEKYFKWVTERGGLRDIVSVTASAYIFVLPFILYKMGNLSLVAIPANLLVLPFIPFTMALGFFTGLFGLIWSGLALPLGFLSYWLLHYEMWVISLFSSFSFASFSVPNFPLWATILVYIWFVYKLFGRNIALFFKGI